MPRYRPLPLVLLTASLLACGAVSACSGRGDPTDAAAFAPATSADAAVPGTIEGFEVQKVPSDQIPPVPTIGGQPATEAAFAVVLGQAEDVYRVVAFRTAQDPASIPEEQRLAVVATEGAQVSAASREDVSILGMKVLCYDTKDFGDVTKPDKVCTYVDGVDLVYVVTQDQGSGGGEEFTRRVLTSRASG